MPSVLEKPVRETLAPRAFEGGADLAELRSALAAEGFTNLPEEWWHFTHKPELFPDTYFDFPIA